MYIFGVYRQRSAVSCTYRHLNTVTVSTATVYYCLLVDSFKCTKRFVFYVNIDQDLEDVCLVCLMTKEPSNNVAYRQPPM